MDNVIFFNILKILHIISVVSWMAALFYLPRLFVYHSEYFSNKGFLDVVKIQEKKLFDMIAQPAMIVTFISGIALMIFYPVSIFKSGMWIHIKLTAVIFLMIYHYSCWFYLKKFEKSSVPPRSGKFFRFYNEVPTILLIIIVVCAVLRF